MKKKLSLFHCSYFKWYCISIIISLLYYSCGTSKKIATSSEAAYISPSDTVSIADLETTDQVFFSLSDSLQEALSLSDTLLPLDSLMLSQDSISPIDSTQLKRISPNAMESIVTYDALDSIFIDIKERKAYLFKTTVVYYDDMELHADYTEIDFKNNELYSSGVADYDGHIHGHPVFLQGGSTFWAHEIRYNFTTKKGKVTDVITAEGEGFIHGKQVKMLEEHSFISKGKYTTCELDHPHFQISFTKAKVIPGNKIITGPAYLSFVDIPTFLAIPFGYFPNESGRTSGFVMPTFGETTNLGFYFENIGYYFGISDNFDLLFSADIYTRGSWSLGLLSNYVFRYKCNGFIELDFAQNIIGERYTPAFSKTNNFKIKWKHNQDPKSHPTTRFTAHIDIVSRTYNKYNLTSVNDYLSNQYTSNVNFSTNARGIFYLDASLAYNQNTQTGIIDLALPTINMSVSQFYPFRKKGKSGSLKWYDNISMKWTSQFNSSISTYDSLFTDPKTWEEIRLGMKHVVPLTIPIKIAKLINWNTSINFTELWYMQNNVKEFVTYTDSSDNRTSDLINLFRRQFSALHDLSLATSLTTKVYFMYQFKKGGLKAIRHVMTPSLNFTYRPVLSNNTTGTYFNSISGNFVEYSYYDGSIFGSVNTNTQANLGISLDNNLEIKVKSRRDTITGTKKFPIFDRLSISSYYNFAADSLNWAPLSISGSSTIFRQVTVTFGLQFDPYCLDTNGRKINKTEWQVNKRLFRFSSSNLHIGLNWRIDQSLFKGKSKNNKTEEVPEDPLFAENTLGMPNNRPDFSIPWSLTLNYTFSYTTQDNLAYYRRISEEKYEKKIIQTLSVTGDISITKKWKLGFTSGYDFTNKEMSYTSLNVYRDLHCWEMRFEWIPFGYRKGWNFTINVKASVLQDLKLDLKNDFRDNF